MKSLITNFKEKINNLAENKNTLLTFIIFLMIQPILDVYLLFTDSIIDIFKFSPATILRIVIIFALFFILLFSEKNKKHIKYFIIYGILLCIYTAIHLYNCLNINPIINPNYRVSIGSEIFYIIRMLLPLLIIYISYNYKFKFKEMYKVVITVVLLFSVTVIFTHFTKLSLRSYSENDDRITQTAIDWIFHPDSVVRQNDSLSRGIFRGGNQLGNLLVMLLPITIYLCIKKTNFLSCITVFLQIFSCILIGTRIAAMSWIAIIIAIFIMLIYFSYFKKEFKINKYFYLLILITVLFNGFILSKSPTLSRQIDYTDVVEENKKSSHALENLDELNELIKNNPNISNEIKEEFIENFHGKFDIQKVFVYDIYNYKCDPDFWISVMNSPYNTYSNSRKMQFLIAQRLFELNNNTLDPIVGIGFSTTRNGSLYTEQDYFAHYYTLGIAGSILLVYSEIMILLYCIYKIIANLKNYLHFENLIFVMSLSLIFIIALISAHVLDELVVTIFIGFILGQLLNNVKYDNTMEEE